MLISKFYKVAVRVHGITIFLNQKALSNKHVSIFLLRKYDVISQLRAPFCVARLIQWWGSHSDLLPDTHAIGIWGSLTCWAYLDMGQNTWRCLKTPYHQRYIQGRIQNLHCRGGAQVTNEAEGFTEARSAERRRVGERVTPSRRWGSGGLPRKFFEKLHQNGAFWVHFEVINTRFFALKIYMK